MSQLGSACHPSPWPAPLKETGRILPEFPKRPGTPGRSRRVSRRRLLWPRALRAGGELLLGRAPTAAALLTSCPWRRHGGTRRREPRKTSSCPAGTRGKAEEADEGGCRAGHASGAGSQRGLNAPPPARPDPATRGL